MAVHAQSQAAIQAFIESRFPNRFLISVQEYAKLGCESFGSARNRIAAGTFELPIFRRGSRNFVSVADAAAYLAGLQSPGAGNDEQKLVARAEQPRMEKEGTKRSGKYSLEAKAAAKARAAKARAAKAEKAAAKAAAAMEEVAA